MLSNVKSLLICLVVLLLYCLSSLAGQAGSTSESGCNSFIEMKAVLDDFLVNDDTGTTDQRIPAIALDGSGNFVITWYDDRNDNYDIYAQRYDSSGTPLSSNFLVNDDTGTALQYTPAVAKHGSGNFVITWEDWRNGNWDIYAQRYDSSGTTIGSNFRVNDDAGTAWQYSTSIAMDGSGNFVITWYDNRSNHPDIYAQRYDSSGTAIGSNFRANDDPETALQSYPDIAMHGSGSFVITWLDWRNEISDIYAQRYSSAGSKIGSNFKVNDNIGSSNQMFPAIALDGSGNFVITWEDYRNGNADIYTQRYDSAGIVIDSNFKANDDVGTDYQYSPDVALSVSGNLVITWQDTRLGKDDIYAQRYDNSGTPVDSNYLAPDSQYANFDQQYPAVAANDYKIYYTWQDDRRVKGWDIYAKVVDWTWPGMCGDINGDFSTSLSDVVYLIGYLYKSGPQPKCEEPHLLCADTNGDGNVSLADIVYLIAYLYKGGPAPAC